MAKKTAYVPSMSDASVKAKTGKDWKTWFAWLDRAGAQKLRHRDIATLISEQGVPGWWSQNVTVEYERARGLRERYETTSGYSVSISKTLPASLSKLYAATASPVQRKKWFPEGAFKATSQTKDRYLHGVWNENSRLDVGFYAKGEDKAQIAVQVGKLGKKTDVEIERAAWKAALARLQSQLEGRKSVRRR